MSLLFETIRIQDGEVCHIGWHELRMNRARSEYWPGCAPVGLEAFLLVQRPYQTGTIRANLFYSESIEKITFKPYFRHPVKSLKLVEANDIDYHVKYHDRSRLEALLEKRDDCDEVLIVRNNLITDTSMSNVIFFDGNHWYTPARPLLSGTCRERLLSQGAIKEAEITPADLNRYLGCKLINAMREPEEEELIPASAIIH